MPYAVSRAPLVFSVLVAIVGCGKRHGPDVADPGDAGSSDAASASGPVAVRRSLAMSQTHTCALRESGLYCWGENFLGQLGTGDLQDSVAPVKAQVDISDVIDVVASTGRTCVRRSSGEAACFGANDEGQLGDGTHDDALKLTPIANLDDIAQLVLDDVSSCALREDGSVWCWGGSPKSAPDKGSLLPKPIAGLEQVVQIAGGAFAHYCARGAAGWIRCWQLEDGEWTAPTEVPKLAGVRSFIVPGLMELCALMPSGDVACHNLENGSLNNLGDSRGSVALVGTDLVACAGDEDGQWRCWNILPPMLESVGSPPILVPSETGLTELIVAGLRVCLRRADAAVLCTTAASFTPTFEVVQDLPR
jgi:hypothetical protein